MNIFINKDLIGRTITGIRNLTEEESGGVYFGATAVIEFDDGSLIVPLGDDEGNSYGTLQHQSSDGTQKYIYVPKE